MPIGQLAADASDTLDTRQLLKVLMAVKKGDFSMRMPVEHTGVAGKIADTLNDIFKLNQRMASEFARISSAVTQWWRANASYLHYGSKEPSGNLLNVLPGSQSNLLFRKVDATQINNILTPNPTTVIARGWTPSTSRPTRRESNSITTAMGAPSRAAWVGDHPRAPWA